MLEAMTKRKRTLMLGPVAAVVGLTAFAGWWWLVSLSPYQINEDSFGQIRDGMMQAEVEALLGCPPGDYSTREVTPLALRPPGWEYGRDTLVEQRWTSDEGMILVWFTPSGVVDQ